MCSMAQTIVWEERATKGPVEDDAPNYARGQHASVNLKSSMLELFCDCWFENEFYC